jgi:hypothetical protein
MMPGALNDDISDLQVGYSARSSHETGFAGVVHTSICSGDRDTWTSDDASAYDSAIRASST